MATTKLAQLYNPLPFDDGVDEDFTELNAFLRSGIMVEYSQYTEMANQGGMIGEIPFFKPLVTSAEPDYTTDDNTSFSTPLNTSTGKQIYRLAKMGRAWSTMDFAREVGLVGMDPLAAITRKVAKYWAVITEKRLIAAATGVMADNIANDSSDMVNAIYSDAATPAATTIISAEAILDTRQTAGDHQMMFSAIAMHSVTFNTLNKANLIDFIPDSRGEVNFPVYLGMSVVVDDSLTVTAGSNSPSYTTILFAPGAFGFGRGRAEVPSEMDRVPSSGDGGGEDILYTRQNPIIHPQGFQFISGSISGNTATLAELAAAAQWDRVIDRKLTGMAFLVHNN